MNKEDQKRIIFQSLRRGNKELDTIFDKFLKIRQYDLTNEEWVSFDYLLGHDDPDVWDWIYELKIPPFEINLITQSIQRILNT